MMIWPRAKIWCAERSRSLASFEKMCPGSTPSYGGYCSNLNGIDEREVWTAKAQDDEGAFAVLLSDGTIYAESYVEESEASLFAFCE